MARIAKRGLTAPSADVIGGNLQSTCRCGLSEAAGEFLEIRARPS